MSELSEHIDYKLEKAFRFEEEGKYLHAIQIFEPLLKSEEYCRTAVLHLSDIYEILNKIETAEKILLQYIQENDDAEICKHLCHLLIRHDKFEEVLDVLSKISFDEHPDVYFLAGFANYYLSDFELAINQFSQFLTINESSELHADAYLFLAKAYLNCNKLDDAQYAAEKSIELYSSNPDVYMVLAMIFYHKEMFLHSFEKIRKAISLNPEEAEYLKWSVKILFKLDEYDKAENQLKNFLEVGIPDAEIYTLLGEVYTSLNKIDEANIYFQKVLELDPKNEKALIKIHNID